MIARGYGYGRSIVSKGYGTWFSVTVRMVVRAVSSILTAISLDSYV